MKKFLFLVLISALSLSATAQENGPVSDASLRNTRWKLQMLKGLDSLPPLHKDAWIQFTLQENRFRGVAGCNNITGSYTVGDNNTLHIGPLAGTRMACPEPQMKVEQLLTDALAKANGYIIKGDQLTLMQDNKVLARFDALYLR